MQQKIDLLPTGGNRGILTQRVKGETLPPPGNHDLATHDSDFMKNVDSTGESSVCNLVPRDPSATKLSEKVWKGKTVSTNYALVPEAAALCRQEEVTSYARFCALLNVAFPTVWLLYVLILSNYLQTSGTDGQPTPFLWRTLPVSINDVYLARRVSQVDSLPYCVRKFHFTWILDFVSMSQATH
ncbi:hypothetical protein AVEN_117863-1 [Araneus ventricosus]|uniref:Uncharacterized protein n=1 Tax=Araneus ventricosus TaxID=182803 RepID=A0A4Y2VRM0_ARAVE|nr:hypothetical protein AVEN_117863-1 [Araneus ventricosus]